jgi:carbon monoxide dehydrogenase subunit G
MKKLTSDRVTIDKPVNQVFSFLTDLNNFRVLMPEQVTGWKSDETSCSFRVQGMADLAFRIHETHEPEMICYASEPPSPFKFLLSCDLESGGDEQTTAAMSLEADLPPMLAMMAERPLSNLLNIMAGQLKKALE